MSNNNTKKKNLDGRFLYRLWFYFRRGWSVYIAFPISILNFLVIQYRLLIEKIEFLHRMLPKFWIFIAVVVPTAALIAVLVGWWDINRGAWREEARIGVLKNPVWSEVIEKIENIERKLNKLLENN